MRYFFTTILPILFLAASCTTIEEVNEEQQANTDKALTPLTRSYRYEVSRSELMEPVLAQIKEDQLRRRTEGDSTSEKSNDANPIRIVADACSKVELLAVSDLSEEIKQQLNTPEPEPETKPADAKQADAKSPAPKETTGELRTCHEPVRIEGPDANYFLYNAGSHRSRVLVRRKDPGQPRVPYAEYLLIRRVNLPQADTIRRKVAESNPAVHL